MLAMSDVRKDACFTYVLRRKTMQSLTSVIIRNELSKDLVLSTRKIQLKDNETHLKHTSLSILITTWQNKVQRHYNSILKHQDNT
jgi:hypothetical protein